MGIFALALHAVTSPDGFAGLEDLGPLGSTAERWWSVLGRSGFFIAMVAAGVLAQILRSVLQFAGSVAAAGVQAGAETTLREDLMRRFLALGFRQVRRFRAGDLANLLDQVHYIGHSANRLNQLVTALLLLAAYLVVLLMLSWPATLAAVAVMACGAVLLGGIVRRVRGHADAYKQATVRLSEQVVDLLHGLKVILAFGREGYALSRAQAEIEKASRATRGSVVAQAFVAPLVEGAAAAGVGLVLLIGFFVLGPRPGSGLARFATFLFVLYRMAPRLSVVHKDWALLANYLPFVERTAKFLEEEVPERPAETGVACESIGSGVRFEAVGYTYEGQPCAALADIDFELGRGRMVAVVGESGAGKSTLADLLVRLIDPAEGRITVDGRDLRDLGWESWRQRLGVVGQGTFLFHDSIRENILLGRSADPARLEGAARRALAHDFIARLPAGYDTVIGDQGYRLSGGERQRIAIARAILGDPEILLLDEATSDLDSHSEALIRQALQELRGRCAILAIAHRLSALTAADEILVLHAGQVVERGRHAELLARRGAYARLWQLQQPQGSGVVAEERLEVLHES